MFKTALGIAIKDIPVERSSLTSFFERWVRADCRFIQHLGRSRSRLGAKGVAAWMAVRQMWQDSGSDRDGSGPPMSNFNPESIAVLAKKGKTEDKCRKTIDTW